ncbi:hypothetical protein [Oleiagrimonas soli]|uniref:Uncharacterized protein n=1 Tax=Oleiagrimonas soli TaxID=1543381 RepID=A0A099CY00_9GAMM|nr:hypothetical protein [Oleiagrimonas soli]KGI78873.1 hypothetical protein LF63_0102805 [Oleiagrimonas soli]MBB6184324.1 hypothetical protein [Oleiagrimonas soli]
MIELLVVAAVIGALWLIGSVVGLMFKLVFGLVGGVFSLLGGLLALGVGLIVLPFAVLAMLPSVLPALLVIGVVWLIARSASRSTPAPAAHGSGPA